MRSYIDLATLANWVSMLRADIDGAIWLADDDIEAHFYEQCAHTNSRVVPSATVARQLLYHVEDRGVAGVVATVRQVMPAEDLGDNIFQPGLGDVASLLVASQCCDRVVEDIFGLNWSKACEKEVGPLRDRVIAVAWTLEQVRRLSNAAATRFPANVIEALIDWNDLRPSLRAVASDFGPDIASAISSLWSRATEMTREDALGEFDGMDAIEVLAATTRRFRPRGLQPHTLLSASTILTMIQLAFDFDELERDPVFWRMRRWERSNPRFPLLRTWRLLDPLQVVLDQRYWERDLKLMLQANIGPAGLTAFKMDLDNFKIVNERLGHAVGDEAIRVYCKVVRNILLHRGEVYRRGGDEVVAFAPDLGVDEAAALAEELRCQIESEFLRWGTERGLPQCPTASIGVVWVQPGTSSEEVIQMMDVAQGRAKEQGKNRVICFPGNDCR